MDPDHFQSAADELLDRVAENDLEASQAGPVRPSDNYVQLRQERAGYNRGGMVSQQSAAILTNNRVNSDYFEHAAQAGTERQDSREAVEQSQSRSPEQPAEQSQTNTREAQQEQSNDKTDWNRYTQDKEYRAQVDEQEKAAQQETRQATMQHDRTR